MKKIILLPIILLAGCSSTEYMCSLSSSHSSTPTPIDMMMEGVETPVIISTEAELNASGVCPVDMVQVTGDFCPVLEEVCLNWLDQPKCKTTDPVTKKCITYYDHLRCGEFKNPTVCKSKTKHMNFCIDRYEYPNTKGVKPKLQNTWYEAKAMCEAQDKRLCVDNEWTQACRGPDNLPYPYGYIRDSDACRIDLPWQDPTTHTFEELDKTVPAGSMPKCVSSYGAYDMTGNGDEWCVSSGGSPYTSVLKGGHPHGVRNRCTPRTTSHNESFSFYDTGFRCCKDIK